MFYYTILTHNGHHLVSSLIRSIKETEPGDNYRIMVIDNGSSPLFSPRDGVDSVVYTGDNLPYAVASNRGVAEALKCGATHVAVLSDDVIFKTPHINKIVDLLNFVDFVGPRTVHTSGLIQSSGHFIREGALCAQNLLDDPVTGRFVCSVIGSCVFTKPEKFLKIGGFEESLRYFHEDVAMGLNAWAADFTVWYEPAVTVMHLEGATRGNDAISKMATPLRQRCLGEEFKSQTVFAADMISGRWPIQDMYKRIEFLNGKQA